MQLNWGSSKVNQLVKHSNGEVLNTYNEEVIDCDAMTTLWASFAANNFRLVHPYTHN